MRLHDYLEYYAREQPDHPFAEMEGNSISYYDANHRANRFSHGLLESGLTNGDRFSYLAKNSIDMALMFFAASKVGVVPVPLNYRLAPREWLYILNDAGSKVLFCENEFIEGIETVRRMALVWGVRPVLCDDFRTIDGMIQTSLNAARQPGGLDSGSRIVIAGGSPAAGPGHTDFLRVAVVP